MVYLGPRRRARADPGVGSVGTIERRRVGSMKAPAEEHEAAKPPAVAASHRFHHAATFCGRLAPVKFLSGCRRVGFEVGSMKASKEAT